MGNVAVFASTQIARHGEDTTTEDAMPIVLAYRSRKDRLARAMRRAKKARAYGKVVRIAALRARNALARAVTSPSGIFRSRVKPSGKRYTRRPKHPVQAFEEATS